MSKKKDRNAKYWCKSKDRFHRNKHHLKPRSVGGTSEKYNLLLIEEERHKMWHKLFGNLTLNEVIELLMRMRKAKGYYE